MHDPFPSAAPPIVDIRRVTRQFGNKTALDNISLTVPRGGVFGLIGGNGAGKTTLIRAIAGRVQLDAGEIRLFGRTLSGRAPSPLPGFGAAGP